MLILSLIQHPIPRYHQLTLLLDMMEADETLAILVPKGEGQRRVASLRSLLSKQRKTMTRNNIPYQDFGINSHVMPWTDSQGRELDAMLLKTHRDIRHAINTLFQTRSLI